MKYITNSILVVAALLFVPLTSAQVHTAKQVAAAKDFNIEGVKLGMSKGEFLRLFPEATEHSTTSRPDMGVTELRTRKTAKTSGSRVEFLDGKVFNVFVFYDSSQLMAMGGMLAIIDRLVAKFGKADVTSQGYTDDGRLDFIWRIRAAGFYCGVSGSQRFILVHYSDTKKSNQLKARKLQAADPGF